MESTTAVPQCKDESYCAGINLDENTCENIPDIFVACYASCSGCTTCVDKEVCATLNINSIICKNSPWSRENCPRGCNVCGENNQLPGS